MRHMKVPISVWGLSSGELLFNISNADFKILCSHAGNVKIGAYFFEY